MRLRKGHTSTASATTASTSRIDLVACRWH